MPRRKRVPQSLIRRLSRKLKAHAAITVRKWEAKDGKIDATFISPGFRALAGMLHEQFVTNGGMNYVGVKLVHAPEEGEPIEYEVTIQKVGGETPAEQNSRLREELHEAKAEIERLIRG